MPFTAKARAFELFPDSRLNHLSLTLIAVVAVLVLVATGKSRNAYGAQKHHNHQNQAQFLHVHLSFLLQESHLNPLSVPEYEKNVPDETGNAPGALTSLKTARAVTLALPACTEKHFTRAGAGGPCGNFAKSGLRIAKSGQDQIPTLNQTFRG